jgi:hypothetical protein
MRYLTNDTSRNTVRAFARDQEYGDDIEERVSRLEDAIHELAEMVRELAGEGSTDRRPRAHDARRALGAGSAVDVGHPPVGDVRSLTELQQIYDSHFEQQRLDQQREPLRGDAAAGLRDAAGFTRDIDWHRAAN